MKSQSIRSLEAALELHESCSIPYRTARERLICKDLQLKVQVGLRSYVRRDVKGEDRDHVLHGASIVQGHVDFSSSFFFLY